MSVEEENVCVACELDSEELLALLVETSEYADSDQFWSL